MAFLSPPFARIKTLDSCFRRNDRLETSLPSFHNKRIKGFISDCKERSVLVPTEKRTYSSKQLELIGRWLGEGGGNGVVSFESMEAFLAERQIE